ncbi:MAG TPA: MFS transporter [Acetobacteraceae bacterium]|nr:MFS transporter [Acetobacteraceae bacterium]
MTEQTGALEAGRVRALIAAIAAVTVFGLSVGLAVPLLSLLLDARGTDPVLTGLNAGATFVGVIAGPLLASSALRRLDVRHYLILCLALDIVGFLALRLFQSYGAWLVLRASLGLVGSGIFTASEAWINRLAGDATRGRVIGTYAAALGAGFGLGPLILWATGIEGWAPFLANAAIGLAAMAPLLLAGPVGTAFGGARRAHPLVMFKHARFLLLLVVLFGLYETSVMALLPVWGVRIGLSPRQAAAIISAIYLGGVFLQLPLGWLSDRAGRFAALAVCGAVGMVGALLLPVLAADPAALFALLLVWGGLAGGIYPVALGMAGDRFQDGELLSVNAAIIMAYGIGSFAGPFLAGAAMDAWAPNGLPRFLALLFAALLTAALWRRVATRGRPSSGREAGRAPR